MHHTIPPRSEGSPLQTPNMEERNELRCQARTWGLIPGIVGVVVAITLALLFFGGDWVHHIYRY